MLFFVLLAVKLHVWSEVYRHSSLFSIFNYFKKREVGAQVRIWFGFYLIDTGSTFKNVGPLIFSYTQIF